MSICTKLDDGDYNETQEYVEKVSFKKCPQNYHFKEDWFENWLYFRQ